MKNILEPEAAAAKTGSETLQTAPASAQKRRSPYEMMKITSLGFNLEGTVLQGSVTSNEVAVRNQVGVTNFDGDDTWSSDRFEVDF